MFNRLGFLGREQMRHLREGGWVIFSQKVYTLFMIPFACVGVFIVRLLRPLIIIRWASLDLSRIGGVYSALWYLSEHSNGRHSRKSWDIFYTAPNSPISNQQWFKMLKRHLSFCPFRKFIHTVRKLNVFLPGSSVHMISYSHPPGSDTFKHVLAEPHKLVLRFTSEEEVSGQKMLANLGLSDGTPFVCFHTRDSAYLKSQFPGKDWGYHDYRDTSIRQYIPAVERLISKGYLAVRMGAVVNEKLKSDNPAIIDYATNGKRTDFLDVYLGAKCAFFLGSDSGITIIPEAFKRPVVYTNWVSIQILPAHYSCHGLIIMKKWYSVKERRLLTFPEIFPLAQPHRIQPQEMGVEFIDNSADEIIDVVNEMEQRLKGTWETNKEDEHIQERFWALYADKLRAPNVRIGAMFLRQNRHLLN